LSVFDNLRQLRDVALSIGRRAGEMVLSQPDIKKRVDAVTESWRDSREGVEAWLLGIEDDLWVWIRRMQEQAHRTQAKIERVQNAGNYYHALGLRPGATMAQVKAAWRQKMRENHPDRFANDPVAEDKAHRRAQEINRAYAELTALLTGREDRRGP